MGRDLGSAAVTTWLDADRECYCHVCVPNPVDDGCLDWRNGTAGLIDRHGWSVVGIDAADEVPAWAFTVGLWHSLGSPEIAMFGLSEESKVRSDTELVRALRPSLASTGGRLLCVGTPYAARGYVVVAANPRVCRSPSVADGLMGEVF